MDKKISSQEPESVTQTTQKQLGEDAPPCGLHDYVGFEIRRTYLAMARKFAVSMGSVDLRAGQFGLLAAIAESPNQSQSAIARQLGLDRSTMVPLLDNLQSNALITRDRDPNNRRAHLLNITDQGRALLEKSRPLIDRFDSSLSAGITQAEKQQLLRLLAKVRDNCQ